MTKQCLQSVVKNVYFIFLNNLYYVLQLIIFFTTCNNFYVGNN